MSGALAWNVVTLRDQMVRVERFSCVFFTAMAGNKAGNTNPIMAPDLHVVIFS